MVNFKFIDLFLCSCSDAKRKAKDKKFGYGGVKKGSKSNNRQSLNDVSDYRPGKKGGKGGAGKKKGAGPTGAAKRMGKNRRQADERQGEEVIPVVRK